MCIVTGDRQELTPTDSLLERLDQIPDELVDRPQWCVWRLEHTKLAYQPHRPDSLARSNAPSTFATFCEAVDVFADALDTPRQFTGIGYLFTDDDPFTGVNFDDCKVGDDIASDVLQAIKRMGGYAEISPSETGVKLWTCAPVEIPEGRTGFQRAGLWGCSKVEVYRTRRWFAVTGRRLTR